MEVSGQLHSSALYPRGKSPPPPPDNRCIGGGVGPTAGQDLMEERKILPLLWIEPRQSIPWPVAIPTEVSRLPVKKGKFVKFPYAVKYLNKRLQTFKYKTFYTLFGPLVFILQ
jgi:hypothetical protein